MESYAARFPRRADPDCDSRPAHRIMGSDERGAQSPMTPVATPFFFYLLSGLALLGGLAVITRRNAVHSALALIVTLLAIANLYLMLYAPFVAGVQIILYAGGIMVLFLFVIMLVNLERAEKEKQFNKQWLVAIVASGALGLLFVKVFT